MRCGPTSSCTYCPAKQAPWTLALNHLYISIRSATRATYLKAQSSPFSFIAQPRLDCLLFNPSDFLSENNQPQHISCLLINIQARTQTLSQGKADRPHAFPPGPTKVESGDDGSSSFEPATFLHFIISSSRHTKEFSPWFRISSSLQGSLAGSWHLASFVALPRIT